MASGIGQQLRGARYHRGVTLSDAARDTGVRETHLLALEHDELEAIGIDPVYVRGILRTYANYLELDAAGLLARHRSQAERAGPVGGRTAVGVAVTDRRSSRRRIGTVVGAVLMLAIVAGATFAVLSLRRAPEDREVLASSGGQGAVPSVTATEAPPADAAAGAAAAASEEASPDSVEVEIPQGPTPEGLTMKLEFTDQVWIRVLVDGENKLEGIMRPGAVTQFTGNDEIELRIGVADAVEFSLNGAWYGNIASDLEGPVNVTCTPETSCRVTREG